MLCNSRRKGKHYFLMHRISVHEKNQYFFARGELVYGRTKEMCLCCSLFLTLEGPCND